MTAALAVPTTTPQEAPRAATIRPAPRREPPFDDELVRPRLCLIRGRDQELPFPEDGQAAVERQVHHENLPDPAVWGRRLLIGLAETAAGRRPLNQVAALLAPAVYRGIGMEFERAGVRGTRHWLHSMLVRNVRVSEPSEGVAELCATVQTKGRVRAVALRLDAHQGRWRCSSLQLG